MIQRARADANQCVTGTGDGIVGVFVTENLGSSMRVETNGFQKSAFNSWCGPRSSPGNEA